MTSGGLIVWTVCGIFGLLAIACGVLWWLTTRYSPVVELLPKDEWSGAGEHSPDPSGEFAKQVRLLKAFRELDGQ